MKVLAAAACWNEEKKIGFVCDRMRYDLVDEFLVVDDGSTDNTAQIARDKGATVVSLPSTLGAGVAIREMIRYAREHKYEVIVFLAGNNKDDPDEIARLLEKIEEGYDFVQGSRFLPGGKYGGDMPLYRVWATKLHAFLMGLITGKKITESTNGFRAVRMTVFDDPRIDLNQSWLDNYELEPYLLYKVLTLGYRHTEVPVTKIYPPKHLGTTKMRPIIDWWRILKPLVLLGLGLRS